MAQNEGDGVFLAVLPGIVIFHLPGRRVALRPGAGLQAGM
jgi:hypothetical protein